MTEPKTEHDKAEQAIAPVAAVKSKGEKAFDRGVYAGFAGVGTFLLTVPVTYLLKYHGKVAPHFERAVDTMHRGLSKIFPALKRETADKVMTTTALMMGGNMMLLPIGVAEKHKVAIVSGLNTAMGDPAPPEQIEKAPKQTWGSLIESRLVAWLAVFTAFKGAEKFVPKTLTLFEQEVGERMCTLLGKPKERMVAGKLVPSKTYLFGKIGALDFFATIAAATLLYVGGHFFARRHEEKKEIREARRHNAAGDAPDAQGEDGQVDGSQAVRAVTKTQVTGEKQHAGRLQSAAEIAPSVS